MLFFENKLFPKKDCILVTELANGHQKLIPGQNTLFYSDYVGKEKLKLMTKEFEKIKKYVETVFPHVPLAVNNKNEDKLCLKKY